MVSTIAAGLLGVVFWIVAAHMYSRGSVGRGAAQVSAMTLIAQIAQVNLSYAFVRFLPQAGARSRRLIASGYLLCSVLGAGLAVVFVLTPVADGIVPAGLVAAAVFTIAVSLWTIFVVQDGVLTGLRRAPWVPVENSLFGVAKLALLPVLVAVAVDQGVFLAWTIPVLPAVAVVNALVFARVVRHEPAAPTAARTLTSRRRRALTSFLGAQYVIGVASAASSFLVPLIVIKELGARENAYFYFPWLVGIALSNLLGNVVASFIVEASHEEEPFRKLFWGTARLMALVTAAGMVLTLAAGPALLGALGSDYADAGSALIRWIGLSLPFAAVVSLTIAGLWMEQRFWLLAGLEVARMAVLIALTSLLIGGQGIDAPGIARFVETLLFAALCLPWLIRWYRSRVERAIVGIEPIGALSPR